MEVSACWETFCVFCSDALGFGLWFNGSTRKEKHGMEEERIEETALKMPEA